MLDKNYKEIDQVKIVEKIFEVVQKVNDSEKLGFYTSCNKMECSGDKNLQNSYADKLKQHLISTDHNSQKIGLQAFSEANFIEEQKQRQIIKDILDWLRNPGLEDKYQPFSIRAVAKKIRLLSRPEERSELIQFIFDELRKTDRVESINLGFEILSLKELKLKYEERKENFDDLKLRIENEGNIEIKKIFISNLKKIKPMTTNKKNEEFWDWLDTQNL